MLPTEIKFSQAAVDKRAAERESELRKAAAQRRDKAAQATAADKVKIEEGGEERKIASEKSREAFRKKLSAAKKFASLVPANSKAHTSHEVKEESSLNKVFEDDEEEISFSLKEDAKITKIKNKAEIDAIMWKCFEEVEEPKKRKTRKQM